MKHTSWPQYNRKKTVWWFEGPQELHYHTVTFTSLSPSFSANIGRHVFKNTENVWRKPKESPSSPDILGRSCRSRTRTAEREKKTRQHAWRGLAAVNRTTHWARALVRIGISARPNIRSRRRNYLTSNIKVKFPIWPLERLQNQFSTWYERDERRIRGTWPNSTLLSATPCC